MIRRCLVAVFFMTATSFAHAQDRPGIGFRANAAESDASVLQVGGALLIVVALALVALYAARRFAPWLAAPAARQRGAAAARLVESVRLAPRMSLFVVEFGAERILLAYSEHGVTVVSRSPLSAERSEAVP